MWVVGWTTVVCCWGEEGVKVMEEEKYCLGQKYLPFQCPSFGVPGAPQHKHQLVWLRLTLNVHAAFSLFNVLGGGTLVEIPDGYRLVTMLFDTNMTHGF